MTVDPEREITLTLPFGMVTKLKDATKILAMFRDEPDVRAVIEIINAIHAGAMEFIRQEDGDLMDYLSDGESDGSYFVKPGHIDYSDDDDGN